MELAILFYLFLMVVIFFAAIKILLGTLEFVWNNVWLLLILMCIVFVAVI
jgi:hypothetical protein